METSSRSRRYNLLKKINVREERSWNIFNKAFQQSYFHFRENFFPVRLRIPSKITKTYPKILWLKLFFLFKWKHALSSSLSRSSHHRCSIKKAVLKNFANFVNFAKFLRTTLLQNTSGRLVLSILTRKKFLVIRFENIRLNISDVWIEVEFCRTLDRTWV